MQGMFGKEIKEDPLANSNIRALTGENPIIWFSEPVRISKEAECRICVLSFPIFREEVRVRICLC